MFENIQEEAFKLAQKLGRVTPLLLMKKFKINCDFAVKLCDKVRLMQHNYARELAKRVDSK